MLPLTNMLTELHLSGFKQHLTHLEQQAIEQHWSYGDFLAKLCEQELAKRYQTRITSWRKMIWFEVISDESVTILACVVCKIMFFTF